MRFVIGLTHTDDPDTENDFVKKNLGTSTSRQAPRRDPALETFINACFQQFLDQNKRRQIRDNLTEGQRVALKELTNLPLTHNAACRYADKEGVTVITPLDRDDEMVHKELNNRDFYDILPNNPTPDTTLIVQEWIRSGLG